MKPQIQGVVAAAVTPLNAEASFDHKGMLSLLEFLAGRGCHGALLLGTTGEGPSFSPEERCEIYRAGAEYKRINPDFLILAGTGTPSLQETIDLTRQAFEAGLDGVVVLPPYYYRSASQDGLFSWFQQVIERSLPPGGSLLGYHIPSVSGVAVPPELMERLHAAYPAQFQGLKDSSGDPEHARLLGQRFHPELKIFNGNDRLFSLALEAGASGCITALANLVSPRLREVWDGHVSGESAVEAQDRLSAARAVSDRYPPAPALLKGLLAHSHGFPQWSVRPPLMPLPAELIETAAVELAAAQA